MLNRVKKSRLKPFVFKRQGSFLLSFILIASLLAGGLVQAKSSSASLAEDNDCTLSRKARKRQHFSTELVFNSVRRNLLAELLLGQEYKHNIIDERIRYNIHRQASVPPGIRKGFARGKVIPPVFLKKVLPLPPSVNDYLGFPNTPNLQVGVLGGDVLLYNPGSGVIYDLLTDLL